MSMAAIIF